MWLALYLLFRKGLKKANHLCSCITHRYPFCMIYIAVFLHRNTLTVFHTLYVV